MGHQQPGSLEHHRGVDLTVGDGTKIKICVRHNGAVGRMVNKRARLKDYWLVVSAGVTDKNELGYTLNGCEGGEAEGYARMNASGRRIYRVLDLSAMRHINLVRRIAGGAIEGYP